jgi:3'-phosphoadenosine 5'-phosphosulfate sulfotransferase (PAPS reductase)/FAD synthetase
MDKPVIASVSGGKDSTALCLHLQEQGIPYRAVHMDTGWEHPETDWYLREVLPRHIGDIEWIMPERGMAELILHKGIFPSRKTRFCTELLKLLPLIEWMNKKHPDGAINAVGIRAAESKARSKLGYCECNEWGWTWRPLIRWAEADVIDIHQRNNVLPNPLYLPPYNCQRVGCWPCLYSRKAEVATVARITPERIDEIRQMEHDLALTPNRVAKLEDGPPRWVPTFFVKKQADGCGNRITQSMRIDEVVKWAKTGRGGRQYELFHEPDRSGCMRWGMCDA